MAIPLIPFAAGVALGALVTYGYKDSDARNGVTEGARWLYDASVGAVMRLFGSRSEEVAESAQEAKEAVVEAATAAEAMVVTAAEAVAETTAEAVSEATAQAPAEAEAAGTESAAEAESKEGRRPGRRGGSAA